MARPKPKLPISDAEEKQIVRQVWHDFVKENLKDIMESMRDKAVGLKFIDAEGDRVYEDKPDPVAAKLLLEHAIGRAPESLEVSGKNGGPIVIKWEE